MGSTTPPRGARRAATAVSDVGTNPDALQASPVDAWYWNDAIDTVFVKVFDNRADTTVAVDY